MLIRTYNGLKKEVNELRKDYRHARDVICKDDYVPKGLKFPK